jgi:hypothetical protein
MTYDAFSAGYNAKEGQANPHSWMDCANFNHWNEGREYAARDRALAPKSGRFEPMDEQEGECTTEPR